LLLDDLFGAVRFSFSRKVGGIDLVGALEFGNGLLEPATIAQCTAA
jgi:hypothetical protein